jgi:hypothetical protein
MLNHPDPIIQQLFDDITEQRDIAMVKCANLVQANKQAAEQITALTAEVEALKKAAEVPAKPVEGEVLPPAA